MKDSLFTPLPCAAMATNHDDSHVTNNLKRKREEFLHGITMVDQLLNSYEEILSNAGVCLFLSLQFASFPHLSEQRMCVTLVTI